MRSVIEDYWRDLHHNHNYDLVYSPHIGRANLWQTSSHLDFYQDAMYAAVVVDQQEYYLKPMNCPFHIKFSSRGLRSYRDLPMRFAELGTVYRYERSGVLHGLMRVRGFTQDDAHIFCQPEQVESEVGGVLDMTFELLEAFGFNEYSISLSTRPEKSVGDTEMWDHATSSLQNALVERNLPYDVTPAAGPSTARKSTSRLPMPWAAPGNAPRCSSISTFPSGLTSRSKTPRAIGAGLTWCTAPFWGPWSAFWAC